MDKISFWNDVYGFDMTSMQENIYREPLVEKTPIITVASDLAGESHEFLHFDLHRTTVEDLSFQRVPFSLGLAHEIDSLDGFVLWFDAIFGTGRVGGGGNLVTLSTGPQAKDTHWHQVKLLIDHLKRKPIPLAQPQRICGNISYTKPAANPRQLLIAVDWTTHGEGEQPAETEKGRQTWLLE